MKLPTMLSNRINRRKFIHTGASLASTIAIAGCVSQEATRSRRVSPNEKLNIGMIGGGGKAVENLKGVSSENVVAICDVDEVRAAEGFKLAPQAKHYRDFRKMLEAEKSLDAVMVTTPDHTHAVAAVMAMKMGKHVYCEKPLTQSVYEARMMRDVARKYKVATQMGNQGHSFDSTRRVVELVRAGVIGPVSEVHVWTDRPIWPQGLNRPTETPPVPSTLDWDLWLGPAPYRPYNPAYLPFNWRGWWDFGTGALGDMACHYWNADKFQILPEEKFKTYPQPPQTIPRSPGHYKEWIAACKGGPPAMSNFDYASQITEAVLLGNVALRLGKKIEWDPRNMRAK